MASEPQANGRTTPALQQNGDVKPGTASSSKSEEEAEVRLEGEELFMTITPEEEEEWRKRIEDMECALQTRKDNFVQWQDGVTRRRMFAYSRLRKLAEAGRQRAAFLNEISAYFSGARSNGKDMKSSNRESDIKEAGKEKKASNKESTNMEDTESQEIDGNNDTVSTDTQQQPHQQQENQQQHQEEEDGVTDDTVTVKPLLRNSN